MTGGGLYVALLDNVVGKVLKFNFTGGKWASSQVDLPDNATIGIAASSDDTDQIMLITNGGTLVRTRAAEISQVGRNTQGVTIFNVANNERVVSVAKIDESEEEDIELDGGDELAAVPDATVGEDLSAGPEDGE